MKKLIIFIIFIIFIGICFFTGLKVLTNDKSFSQNLFENKSDSYQVYTAGDIVYFKNQDWYVMYDSDSKSDYVSLISNAIWYLEDEKLITQLDTIYEISDLKKYLEDKVIAEYGIENLVDVAGYKIRLFNLDDFKALVNYEYNNERDEYLISSCPSFICIPNTYYATMIDTNSNKELVNVFNNVSDVLDMYYEDYTLHLKYYNLNSLNENKKLESLVNDITLFVRPVINVYKKALEKDEMEEYYE